MAIRKRAISVRLDAGWRSRLTRIVRRGGLPSAVLAAALLSMSCSSNPMQPTPTLTLTCPASVTTQSPDGNAVVVTFTGPQTSGGTAPVASTCSSQSGWTYPVGSTPVTCTATDAKQQTASCRFQVNVTAPPQLTATKFVAFGDSITAGQLNPPCPGASTLSSSSRWFLDDLRQYAWAIDLEHAYPNQLQISLRSRYTTQTPTVSNEGVPGECAIGCTPPNGVDRLPGVLAAEHPNVLLLQEGVNNLNAHLPSSIPNVITGLQTMIRQAKAQGVPVMVGTLLPERAGACRGYAPDLIAPANDAIRSLVASEGQTLVDLYAAFGGVAGDLIGNDGLHPTEQGYAKIAETFYEEIKRRLEVPSQAARPSLSSRPGPRK
jgi:lysophospholipase L1-like esterase